MHRKSKAKEKEKERMEPSSSNIDSEGVPSLLLLNLAYRHGLWCASHPLNIIVAVSIACVVLTVGTSGPANPLFFGDHLLKARVWTTTANASIPGSTPSWVTETANLARVRLMEVRCEDSKQDMRHHAVVDSLENTLRGLLAFNTVIDGRTYDLQDFCLSPQHCIIHPFMRNESLRAFLPAPLGFSNFQINDLLVHSSAILGHVEAVKVLFLLRPLSNRSLFESEIEKQFFEKLSAGIGFDTRGADLTTFLFYETRQDAEKLFLVVVYVLLFLYISFSVWNFELVKSKFWLGFAIIGIQVFAVLISIGLCRRFVSSITPVEFIPFLVACIGFNNISIITKSVVSFSLEYSIRVRVALGLAKAAAPLVSSFILLEFILVVGMVFSSITVLHEFCIVAVVGVLVVFILQITFYVAVLSLDLRRWELSDVIERMQFHITSPNRLVRILESEGDTQGTPGITYFWRSVLIVVLAMSFAFVGAIMSQPQPVHQTDLLRIFGNSEEDHVVFMVMPTLRYRLHVAAYTPVPPAALSFTYAFSVILSSVKEISLLVVAMVVAYFLITRIFKMARVWLRLREETDAISGLRFLSEQRTLHDHAYDVECLSLPVPSNGKLISSCIGSHIRVWDQASSECEHDIDLGGESPPWLLSSHGDHVAAAFARGEIKIWDTSVVPITTQTLFVPFEECGNITCFTFHGGPCLYVATAKGYLLVYHLEASTPRLFSPEPSSLRRCDSDGSVSSLARRPSSISMESSHLVSPLSIPPHLNFEHSQSAPLSPEQSVLAHTPASLLGGSSTPPLPPPPTTHPTHRRINSDGSNLSNLSTISSPLRPRKEGILNFSDDPPPSSTASLTLPPPSSLPLSDIQESPAHLMQPPARPPTHRRIVSEGGQRTPPVGLLNSQHALPSAHNSLTPPPLLPPPLLPPPLTHSPQTTSHPYQLGGPRTSTPSLFQPLLTHPASTSPNPPPMHFPPSSSSTSSPMKPSHRRTGSNTSEASRLGSHEDLSFQNESIATDFHSAFSSLYNLRFKIRPHAQSISVLGFSSTDVITGSADRKLQVISKGSLQVRKSLFDHVDVVTSLEVDHEAGVSGSACGEVVLWTDDWSTPRRLEGHSGSILCLRMNESYIVSSAEDNTVRIWLRKSGRCIQTISQSSAQWMLALHSSSILITACSGKLSIWDLFACGERLKTIPLTDIDLSLSLSSVKIRHLLLDRNALICDFGKFIKIIDIPFPQNRLYSSKAHGHKNL